MRTVNALLKFELNHQRQCAGMFAHHPDGTGADRGDRFENTLRTQLYPQLRGIRLRLAALNRCSRLDQVVRVFQMDQQDIRACADGLALAPGRR